MEVAAGVDAPIPVEDMVAWVSSLSSYPAWLDVVEAAAPVEPGDDEDAAWLVTLRGKVGPLARVKRLRMVRTDLDPEAGRVVFERRELDGRAHGTWELTVDVTPTPSGCHVAMDLRYDGRFGGAILDRLLADEIRRARPRLLASVTGGPPPARP